MEESLSFLSPVNGDRGPFRVPNTVRKLVSAVMEVNDAFITAKLALFNRIISIYSRDEDESSQASTNFASQSKCRTSRKEAKIFLIFPANQIS